MKLNLPNGVTMSSITLTVLVITAELLPGVKQLLENLFFNHWAGKAIIVTAVFLTANLPRFPRLGHLDSATTAWYATLASLAAIALFYGVRYFIM